MIRENLEIRQVIKSERVQLLVRPYIKRRIQTEIEKLTATTSPKRIHANDDQLQVYYTPWQRNCNRELNDTGQNTNPVKGNDVSQKTEYQNHKGVKGSCRYVRE